MPLVLESPTTNQFIGEPLPPEYESYKNAIENLAASDDKSVFQNSDPVHAAIVLGNIFKKATKYVKIFAGRLNGQISNNSYYLQSLQILLEKKIPLTILLEGYPDYNTNAFKLLKTYSANSAPFISVSVIKSYGVFFHYTIADDCMFRLEVEANSYSAYCSFNNIETTKLLNTSFNVSAANKDVII
jgi:hypothetical protein